MASKIDSDNQFRYSTPFKVLFFLKLTLEKGGPSLKGPLRVFAIAFEGEKAMAQKRGPFTGWPIKFGSILVWSFSIGFYQ